MAKKRVLTSKKESPLSVERKLRSRNGKKEETIEKKSEKSVITPIRPKTRSKQKIEGDSSKNIEKKQQESVENKKENIKSVKTRATVEKSSEKCDVTSTRPKTRSKQKIESDLGSENKKKESENVVVEKKELVKSVKTRATVEKNSEKTIAISSRPKTRFKQKSENDSDNKNKKEQQKNVVENKESVKSVPVRELRQQKLVETGIKVNKRTLNEEKADKIKEVEAVRQSKRIKTKQETELNANKSNNDSKELNAKQKKPILNVNKSNSTSKKVKQTVKIVEPPAKKQKRISQSPPTRQLRKKKIKDYNLMENPTISLEEESVTNEKNKLPIYKRENIEENKNKALKKQKDLYEFDLDEEEKVKKRKLSDPEFELSIIKKAKKSKKPRNNQPVINKKKVVNNNKVPVIILNDIKETNKKNELIEIKNVQTNKIIDNKKGQEVLFKTPQTKDITITNNNNNEESGIHKVVENEPPIETIFDSPPRVNIISNVSVGNIDTPSSFKFAKPDANSTMLNNILTPWRFNDINIKRNPHFISIKNSALPNINQDMVIDHSVVEKFIECSKTPSRIISSPKIIQKTLPEYFSGGGGGGNTIIQDKENVPQISLFDNDVLSPIKSNKLGSVSPKRNIAKRIVFSDKTNQNDVVVVAAAEEKKNDNKGNISYFGFDSTDEDLEEINENNQKNKKKVLKNAKPFRLSINVNDKKYQRKRKKSVEKIEEDKVSSYDNEEEEQEVLSDEEIDSGEAKLFEDFTPTEVRLKNVDSFDYDNIKVAKKRKQTKTKSKKNQMTKEEEEAAEKWAEAFNSMCEEVEQFPLQIE